MWRSLSENDLSSTLSAKEINAYRASVPTGAPDPVTDLLNRTAQLVRSYIRAGGKVQVSPEDNTIPEGLISPACDYAAYDVLKRMPVAVGEDRRRAREEAIRLFDNLSSGKLIPEPYGATEPELRPDYQKRRRILDF